MDRIIFFKNKKIHARIEGEGKPLVLLHGFMETLEIWKNFSTALSNGFKVVTIDLPGHGESEMIEFVHSMTLMADAVNTVLVDLNIEDCVMIGHSMGGYVALEFADKFKQKLKGLGLFHSHPLEDSEDIKLNRERMIDTVRNDHFGFIMQFIPALFSRKNVEVFSAEINQLQNKASNMSSEAIIAAIAGMKMRKDFALRLKELDIPFLAILGKDDVRIPMETMLPYFSFPSKSCIFVLDKVGHIYWKNEHIIYSFDQNSSIIIRANKEDYKLSYNSKLKISE